MVWFEKSIIVLSAGIHIRFHLGTHIRLDRLDIPVLAVIECLGAAICYAASSVWQQQSASRQPADLSLRPGLLVALVRSPWWLLGMLADIGGFALQFLALRIAALALVTPLLVVGLIFSIIGAAWASGRRVTRREWRASTLVVGGLVLFLAAAQPGPGHPKASWLGWAILTAVIVVVVVACLGIAHGSPHRRAIFLGVATGTVYGYTLAVTERAGHLLNHGVVHALSTWAPYVLVAASIVGLLINQSAYQAAELQWSLPLITVIEPVVAIIIGQLLFGEYIGTSPLDIAGELIGLVAVSLGVVQLLRPVQTARESIPDIQQA
jgi:drug/metabolite transporter (DMT)-like permease